MLPRACILYSKLHFNKAVTGEFLSQKYDSYVERLIDPRSVKTHNSQL